MSRLRVQGDLFTMTDQQPIDGKTYCPMNSKCRGDLQFALIEDPDAGICDLDHEECHYQTCSTFKRMYEQI